MNAFLFLSSNKMWVAMAGIHKMLDRTANREDSDQQSGLGLLCLSIPFKQARSVQNFRTFTVQLSTLLYFKYLSKQQDEISKFMWRVKA